MQDDTGMFFKIPYRPLGANASYSDNIHRGKADTPLRIWFKRPPIDLRVRHISDRLLPPRLDYASLSGPMSHIDQGGFATASFHS